MGDCGKSVVVKGSSEDGVAYFCLVVAHIWLVNVPKKKKNPTTYVLLF